MNTYLVMDFETGGFNPKEHLAMEFACVAINGVTYEEIERFSYIIKPYSDNLTLTPEAFKVHGISLDEAMVTGEKIEVVVKEFINFVKRTSVGKSKSTKSVLVGHNLAFDIGFLQQIFYYAKMESKLDEGLLKGQRDFYGNFIPFHVCTLEMARELWMEYNDEKRYSLSACIERSNLELNDAHRALNDVLGNVQLFVNFLQNIRKKENGVMGDTPAKRVRVRDTIIKL